MELSDNEETKQDLSGDKNEEPERLPSLSPKFPKLGKLNSEVSAEFSRDSENKAVGKTSQHKGLRLLTIVVKDIVMTRKYTTYKEVAEIILNDGSSNGISDSSQTKITPEEQNIKRRVYDALNVLISAGVLIKEGRYVRKNRSNKLIQLSKLELKVVLLKEAATARS